MNIFNIISAVRHRIPVPNFISDYVADSITEGAYNFLDTYIEDIIINDIEPVLDKIYDNGHDGFWIKFDLTQDKWERLGWGESRFNPGILCPVIYIDNDIVLGKDKDLDILPAYELKAPPTPMSLPIYEPINGVHPGFEDCFYKYHQQAQRQVGDNATGAIYGLAYWANIVSSFIADYLEELGYDVNSYQDTKFVCCESIDVTSYYCAFPIKE